LQRFLGIPGFGHFGFTAGQLGIILGSSWGHYHYDDADDGWMDGWMDSFLEFLQNSFPEFEKKARVARLEQLRRFPRDEKQIDSIDRHASPCLLVQMCFAAVKAQEHVHILRKTLFYESIKQGEDVFHGV